MDKVYTLRFNIEQKYVPCMERVIIYALIQKELVSYLLMLRYAYSYLMFALIVVIN